MATLTLQKVSKSSAALTYSAAAAGGDDFSSFDGVFVHIKNANVSLSRVITVSAITDPLITPEAGSLTVPDVVITVPSSDDRLFALPASHISAGGSVSMTYDDEADLTIAVAHVEQ